MLPGRAHRRILDPRRRAAGSRDVHPAGCHRDLQLHRLQLAGRQALAPRPLAGVATGLLRLTSTPTGNEALLVAGAGTAASLLAARTGDGGAHWALSAPVRPGAAAVRSSGFGAGGAAWAVLSDGRAETISGQATAWRALPAVPPGTAALAPGPSGGFDALAVSGSKLTIWRLDQVATAWTRTQVINVPIEYGSSS